MIILDASVLIAHVEIADAHHERARRLLTNHRQRQFAASAITLAEFLVLPTRRGRVEAARRALDLLGVEAHGLDAAASWRLAELRAQTGLKLPDCCVLYTALLNAGCLIATFDDVLKQQAHRLGVNTAE